MTNDSITKKPGRSSPRKLKITGVQGSRGFSTGSLRQVQPAAPQLHFNWAEEAVVSAAPALDCLEAQRDDNNLVYLKPYAVNVPAYRRVVPKGTEYASLHQCSISSRLLTNES